VFIAMFHSLSSISQFIVHCVCVAQFLDVVICSGTSLVPFV